MPAPEAVACSAWSLGPRRAQKDLPIFPATPVRLRERVPLRLEGEPVPKIRQGALCLNDPGQAQVCLATFEVSPTLNLPGSLSGNEHQRFH